MAEYVLLGLVLAAVATIGIWTVITGISPVPTPPRVTRTMLSLAPEGLAPGPIADLGSGWGNLARAFARAHPGRAVIGYELSPLPFACAWLWQRVFPLPNLTFRRENFLTADLSSLSLAVCYLYPGGMARLERKLAIELRPATPVISHFFTMPAWTPEDTRRADDQYASPVYLYRVPETPSVPPQVRGR